MTDFNEKFLIGTITLIIGVVLKHYLEKYLNRITKLKLSIWHNYIGSSIEDVKFGSVKLLYNQSELKNLYASNVTIKNDSGKDLKDLEINISCDNQSLILVSNGRNLDSIKELEFTASYAAIIEKNDPNDATYIYTRRDYKIPVINRGDTIEITLLTTNSNQQRPTLFVTTEHVGVKLNYYLEPIKLMGVPQLSSIIIGIIISILLCFPLLKYISNDVLIVSLSLFNGLFASFYGIALLKLNNWIKRQFE